MSAPILQLKDLELSIGTLQLFKGLDLSLEARARVCLVGRNGSGKSTLMKVIADLVEADHGEVFIQPGIKISYMPQDPDFPPHKTALAYIEDQEGATPYEAEKILAEVGIAKDQSLENLSGGEARRVSLAHALVTEPDILLLDEPTNHLDVATIQWLEKKLKAYQGSVILISHDRTFLSNTTSVTFWLERGKVRRLNKGYAHFQDWADKIREEEAKNQLKLSKVIEQETQWAQKGITARRKRNQGRLTRLYELREKRAQQIKSLKMARLETESPHKSARHIIEARQIAKAYGDKVLVKDFSTNITRGDRIGIIGPNGAGKTTLLKMLIGELKPDTGKVKINKRLETIYLDQKRTQLDPKKTLWQLLCPNGGDFVQVQDKQRHVVAYLKDFMFHPDQVKSPIGSLSGGEKNRLLLALSLAQTSNLMVLDEPTNDLDMDTLDRLQDMLCQYEGTLLVVTHDRSFLDHVVTSTIVLEGDGTAIEYAGGYQDYLKQSQGKTLSGPKSSQPSASQQRSDKKAQKEDSERKKSPSLRLSYKQKYALEILPQKITLVEEKILELESALSDRDLYQQDPEKAQRLAKALLEAQAERDTLETQWLELEMLRDEIEN